MVTYEATKSVVTKYHAILVINAGKTTGLAKIAVPTPLKIKPNFLILLKNVGDGELILLFKPILLVAFFIFIFL